MGLPLSLVLITLNEESNIERCIRSASFADEVIVLDSGSTDKTAEIATNLGAKVFQQDWLGFGPQKHKAVTLAKNDWVLCLDADEALSAKAQDEIKNLWNTLDEKSGYEFPRKSFYLGRWIMHGGWYPDYQLRLFNRKYSQWDQQTIHEKVSTSTVKRFSAPIEHFVFKDVNHHIATNNRYSSLQAHQHFQKGQKFSYYKFIIKPWVKFLECYFLKAGFLDGLPGFFIAIGAAYSVFIRWGKVYELEMSKK